MYGIVFVFLYGSVAAYVTAHAYYHGVMLKPPIRIYTAKDHVALALAALAIGSVWPLFLPGLAVVAVRQLAEHLERLPAIERFRHPEHARAGS